MQIAYELIRSRRKTLALQIRDGKVIVRAPMHTGEKTVERFVQSNERWIRNRLAKEAAAEQSASEQGFLSDAELRSLAAQAKRILPQRVALYAERIGVSYGRITVRTQQTRWGSCSAKGNLSFNCLLMLAPVEVLDSVIVHELCHRKQMNHSARFYSEVYRAYPDYDRWHDWLKTNGGILLRRAGKRG